MILISLIDMRDSFIAWHGLEYYLHILINPMRFPKRGRIILFIANL